MNSLSRTIRALVWGILIGWMVSLVHRFLLSVLAQRPEMARQPRHSPASLYRDPWCGTYVAPEISFPLEQAGQTEYFCSADCRERYLRSRQQAISA